MNATSSPSASARRAVGVGAVDGERRGRRLLAEAERRPDVAGGRALGELDVDRRAGPGALAQQREQTDADADHHAHLPRSAYGGLSARGRSHAREPAYWSTGGGATGRPTRRAQGIRPGRPECASATIPRARPRRGSRSRSRRTAGRTTSAARRASRSPAACAPDGYRSRPWTMRQYAGFALGRGDERALPAAARARPDRASRWPSTCRRSSASTRTTRAPPARSGAPASRSTRSRTCARLFDGIPLGEASRPR